MAAPSEPNQPRRKSSKANRQPAEAIPPAQASKPKQPPKGKLASLIGLLERPDGAVVDELVTATGWQAHSVRGAISGALKKKLGLVVTSEKSETGRRYRIVRPDAEAGA